LLTADRLSRAQLHAVQARKLSSLGERLSNNTFYGPRLRAARGTLNHQTLRDVEPITKEDVLADQAAHPPFGARASVDPSLIEMIHTTGGTSGRGREIYGLTAHDVEAVALLSSLAFEWAGMALGDPVAYNVGLSNSSGGNCMISAVKALGRSPILIGHAGFEERLELLKRFPPVGMYGTPSAINGLARTAEDLGFDLRAELADLRFILVSAEPYPLQWAEAMEEAWGARLFEDYGLTQSGSSICAATCERGAAPDGRRGHLHLFDWTFLWEVLDPKTLEPVPAGEEGELVLTTLDKQASPVVRFRTNDRVHYLGRECPCGRELMSIETGTISRYDDMLKIKGQNVWQRDIEAVLLANRAVVEFEGRVVIGGKGRDDLILRIAPADAADSAGLASAIRTEFKRQFNITPVVELVAGSELESYHSPERKARRIRDDRQAGLSETHDSATSL
jgi:phenylacetate-CoA ligase